MVVAALVRVAVDIVVGVILLSVLGLMILVVNVEVIVMVMFVVVMELVMVLVVVWWARAENPQRVLTQPPILTPKYTHQNIHLIYFSPDHNCHHYNSRPHHNHH